MELVPEHKRDTAVSLLRSFDTEGNGRVSSSDYHRVLQMLNVAVPVGHQAAEGGLVAYTQKMVQERDARPAQAPAADEMRPHMHEVGDHRWGEESAPAAGMRPHMHEVGGHHWGEETKPCEDDAYRFRRPASRAAADVVASLMTRLDGNPLPLRNAMRQSDGDKDGILSKREFTQALERIGVDTTGVREQELLAAIGRLVPQQVCFIVCPCRMHMSGVYSRAVVLWCCCAA